MSPVLYLSHPASLYHDTGAHPERADRLRAIEAELSARDWLGCERAESPEVQRDALEAVHQPGYVAAIERFCLSGGGNLDPDTVAGPASWPAALHAAGGAVELVDRLLDGSARTGFSAHRPPGHHAKRATAMGFCLFNNVAVAAQHALDAHGLERVLVLDWDVHHGNGTNDIFHATPTVLYASIHEYPMYPGTGSAADVGSGPGAGYTLNLPVPTGAGDELFTSLVEHVVVPVSRAYAPQLVLVSAGYDAHIADPLAGCRVTESGYATMTGSMTRLSAELGVPLGFVLEGGYALGALAASVVATIEVLSAEEPPAAVEIPLHPIAPQARERLVERWRLAVC